MAVVLLKIGSTDITASLDPQNCQINREPVFDAWTDGNAVDHRNVSRTRITGKAVAGFYDATAFSAFCTLLSTELQTDGYYNVTAYVNNTGTTETFQAYIDYSASTKWDWLNSRQWHVITMQIVQR